MKDFEVEMTTGIFDCDAYKIVHNARYIEWYEQALYMYWTEKLGADCWENTRLKIKKIRCRYISALKFNDEFKIITTLSSDKTNENKYHFKQKIVKLKTLQTVSISQGIVCINCRKEVQL